MNILILCTGNSARSILGEAIINAEHAPHKGFSAGSNPTGKVNPAAIAVLKNHNYDTSQFESKSTDFFTQPNSPKIDFVISVCANAEKDCPIWPGNGDAKRLHWPLPDPADVEGEEEKLEAFENTYQELKQRLGEFISTL